MVGFAEECHVPHLSNSFAELGDLVGCALSPDLFVPDWDEDDLRKKFRCLNTSNLAILLEKFYSVDENYLSVVSSYKSPSSSATLTLPPLQLADRATLRGLIKKLKQLSQS